VSEPAAFAALVTQAKNALPATQAAA
jgi:hypothetical protein